MDAEAIRRLEVSQRRALVCLSLERSLNARRSRAEHLLSKCFADILLATSGGLLSLGSLETLLYVLWRHVCYYLSEQPSSPGSVGQQRPFGPTRGPTISSQSHLKASVLRYLTKPDPDAFRCESSVELTKVIEKIVAINLVSLSNRTEHSKLMVTP